MLRRRWARAIARLALGVVLFAQGALVLAACDWERRAPAQAIVAADQMPCCPEAGGVAGNANLCLAHCTSDIQSADSYSPPLPPRARVALIVELSAAPAIRVTRGWHAVLGPPLTILFQTFRI